MKKICAGLLLCSSFLSAQKWDSLGSGTQGGVAGEVFALTQYDSNLVAGGFFELAGGIFTRVGIGQWNGTNWDTIGYTTSIKYVPEDVWAEGVYNNILFVAGLDMPEFVVAQWNGVAWDSVRPTQSQLYNLDNMEIKALTPYQGKLYVGGSNIITWDGTNWDSLPTGLIRNTSSFTIYAMEVYNNKLYVGGSFDSIGNVPAKNIAVWNGTNWAAVGGGINNDVSSFCIYNGILMVGGGFDSAGSIKASHIAGWNGSSWSALGTGINDSGGVACLAVYGSVLSVGGGFDSAGGVPANNIAFWDGTNWSALGSGITGNSTNVNALFNYKGVLIAGGIFDSAGGIPVNNIAQWTSPLGINKLTNNNECTIFPNPSTGIFTIALVGAQNFVPATAEIYNILGEKVFSQFTIHNSRFTINLSSQPNGVYFYRVLKEDGTLLGEGKVVIKK